MGIAFLVGFIGFFIATRVAWRVRHGLGGGHFAGARFGAHRRWQRLERHEGTGAALQHSRPAPSLPARPSALATPEALYRMVLDLDLPRRQENDLETILDELSAREPRLGAALIAVADDLAQPALDRAAIAAALARTGAGASIVDGIERIHALLTPDQRQRLRGTLLGTGSSDRTS